MKERTPLVYSTQSQGAVALLSAGPLLYSSCVKVAAVGIAEARVFRLSSFFGSWQFTGALLSAAGLVARYAFRVLQGRMSATYKPGIVPVPCTEPAFQYMATTGGVMKRFLPKKGVEECQLYTRDGELWKFSRWFPSLFSLSVQPSPLKL